VDVDPFRLQLHPDVWLLVAFLIGSYVYMVRVVGPHAVAVGQQVVTRGNIAAFAGAMALLWAASDWPIHDLGENYLYSVHMLQHMMLSFFLPPLALLATPEWLLRTLVGHGRAYGVLRRLCHPVVAAVLFNVAVVVTHIPGVVAASVEQGPAVHYLLHVMVLTTALIMWMPVCGPFPEFHLSTMGKMIYLFLQSVVPTVPAAWLTFAEGAVYRTYGQQPVRVWGLSVTDDQQLAGAIMKTGGSIFLWSIIIVLWFTRFSAAHRAEYDYHRGHMMPSAEITGHDEDPLTYDDVEREFARIPAASEPERRQ
jgi:putative membrane protein